MAYTSLCKRTCPSPLRTQHVAPWSRLLAVLVMLVLSIQCAALPPCYKEFVDLMHKATYNGEFFNRVCRTLHDKKSQYPYSHYSVKDYTMYEPVERQGSSYHQLVDKRDVCNLNSNLMLTVFKGDDQVKHIDTPIKTLLTSELAPNTMSYYQIGFHPVHFIFLIKWNDGNSGTTKVSYFCSYYGLYQLRHWLHLPALDQKEEHVKAHQDSQAAIDRFGAGHELTLTELNELVELFDLIPIVSKQLEQAEPDNQQTKRAFELYAQFFGARVFKGLFDPQTLTYGVEAVPIPQHNECESRLKKGETLLPQLQREGRRKSLTYRSKLHGLPRTATMFGDGHQSPLTPRSPSSAYSSEDDGFDFSHISSDYDSQSPTNSPLIISKEDLFSQHQKRQRKQ